jgi:hypothetical protein
MTGDHASDAASIRFFDAIHLDYISCSPYQLPGAKLAAAQAHILETGKIFTFLFLITDLNIYYV